jgi:hypothetical protein
LDSGRALPDAHLSDDKAVAKMGHPDFVAGLFSALGEYFLGGDEAGAEG